MHRRHRRTDSKEKRNEPDANEFSDYLGVFEDTYQVVNKVPYSGRTLDITGVTRCAHSTYVDGDDSVVFLQGTCST